ncbi:MAG: HD domain-containing protein [Roseivirga sp.]
MNYLSIDHLIVYAFLLITLAIGLWAGRGIKDIREYAIANKQFGTVALVLTYLATEVGGQGVVNIAGETGVTGIIIIVAFLSFPISFIVQALFIAPKLNRFDHCLTMGDIMQVFYGGSTSIIVGVISFILCICYAGAELIVLGLVCESLLGVDYWWGALISGSMLTFYVMYGGSKSVTITDLLQFLVLLVLLPILLVTALKQVGGMESVLVNTSREKLALWNHGEFYYYLTLFLSFRLFGFNNIDPALIQRMLMAKNSHQLRNTFFTLAGFFTALFLGFMLLGLVGSQLYPALSATDIVPHMVKELLPVGLRGFMMAGVITVGMASADSYLHTAGLTIVHDVIRPLCERNKIVFDELRWARYATLLGGFLIVSLSLMRGDNVYSLIFTALEFAVPLLVFPFYTGIIGLKPDKHAFYISASVTLATFLFGKLLLVGTYSHFLPIICVIVSGLTFFGTHLMYNKGFLIVRHVQKGTKEYLWQPSRKGILALLQESIPTPYRVIAYSQDKVRRYGAPYILFGVFCYINFIVPYFMWNHESVTTYNLMLYLRLIGATLCALLIVQEKWPEKLLPYFPTFWHLTLLYCIPFTSTVMFLLTQGSTEWLINVAITIMFLIVLVDWTTFLILTALGIGLGFCFFTQVIGPINIQLDFTTGYLLVYTLFFSTLIGLLFARRKQQRFDRIAKANEQLNICNKEMVNQLFEAATDKNRVFKAFQQIEAENFRKLSLLTKQFEQEINTLDQSGTLASKFKALREELKPFTNALQRLDHRAADYLSLRVNNISVDKLLKTVHEELQLRGTLYKVDFYQTSQQEAVQCDVERLVALLVSSVALVRTLPNKQTPVHISIADTQLYYFLDSNKRNRIQQLPALCFTITNAELLPQPSAIYTVYMDAHTLSTPASPQELPLAKNKRTVDAHYGYSQVAIQQETVKLQYILPVSVRSVRPVEVEEKERKLVLQLMRADDTHPSVQEQEQAFLTALQDRTTADMRRIRRAVEEIKWYYGVSRSQSGEPSYLYAIQVAHLVLDYDTDELTILGALFHEASKSNRLPWEQMELHYSEEELQFLVTLRELAERRWEIYGPQRSEQENMQGLLSISDRRLLYIQLADRVQRMRLIRFYTPEKQFLLSEESLLFYVPLAKALGLSMASKELYDRSAAVLNREQEAVLEDVRV